MERHILAQDKGHEHITNIYTYIHVYICMNAGLFVCVYVHTQTYIYILCRYIHTHIDTCLLNTWSRDLQIK